MHNCKNPDCTKKIPEKLTYCSVDCMRRHKEQKKENLEQSSELKNGVNLKNEEDIWLGQERRKRAVDTIMKIAKELCPIPYKRFIYFSSYRTGLSVRKISDDYLQVLIGVGLLKRKDNILNLGEIQGGQIDAT